MNIELETKRWANNYSSSNNITYLLPIDRLLHIEQEMANLGNQKSGL